MNNLESYKHKAAKEVLKDWLSNEYVTKTEVPFYEGSKILFIPDVVCYSENKPFAIYEVVHKSDLTAKKLGRINTWCYNREIQLGIYGIEAEWILSQVEKPKRLELINYTIEI